MRRVLLATFIALLVLAGCSGDDDDGDTASTGGETGGEEEQVQAPSGEVPDPCELLTPDEIGPLLGTDPGTGAVQGPVPESRKICAYTPSGLITSVEVAVNWDTTLEVIRDTSPNGDAALEEVSGVGDEAFWQPVGDSGQFLALQGDYFVGVALPGQGQSEGQAIAEAMLAAL